MKITKWSRVIFFFRIITIIRIFFLYLSLKKYDIITLKGGDDFEIYEKTAKRKYNTSSDTVYISYVKMHSKMRFSTVPLPRVLSFRL